jgi:hypothetical protein
MVQREAVLAAASPKTFLTLALLLASILSFRFQLSAFSPLSCRSGL